MRVFISYTIDSKQLVNQLVERLQQEEIDVVYRKDIDENSTDDINHILTGDNFSRNMMGMNDLFLIICSQKSASKSFKEEIKFIRMQRQSQIIMPVLLNDSNYYDELWDWSHLNCKNMNEDCAIEKIVKSILTYQKILTKKRADNLEKQKKIESVSEKYIADSIKNLTDKEKGYKTLSYLCFGACLVFLVLGVVAIFFLKNNFIIPNSNIIILIQNLAYLLVIIGFVVASVKYCFILGRSFMVESLRNADRIHAIKFGEFYLKSFSDNLEWEKLKEAFQHWNIDLGSNFKDLDEKSIDPQFLQNILELIKEVKNSN